MYAFFAVNCGWTVQQIREMTPEDQALMYEQISGTKQGTRKFETQQEYQQFLAEQKSNGSR